MLSGTWARAQARRASSCASASSASVISVAAASTSIHTGSGRFKISSSRPARVEAPSEERNLDSRVRSAASWETGAWLGHSAPISSSRPTCRSRFSTRYASSSGTCLPRSRPASCTPSISTDNRPHSWIRVISRARSGCGNVLETYRQRQRGKVPRRGDPEVRCSDELGGAQSEVTASRGDDGHTTAINGGHRRIAYCECGAQLAGDDEHELYSAAQRHLAHHHPQLLGALGPGMVSQMAEDVGGQ